MMEDRTEKGEDKESDEEVVVDDDPNLYLPDMMQVDTDLKMISITDDSNLNLDDMMQVDTELKMISITDDSKLVLPDMMQVDTKIDFQIGTEVEISTTDSATGGIVTESHASVAKWITHNIVGGTALTKGKKNMNDKQLEESQPEEGSQPEEKSQKEQKLQKAHCSSDSSSQSTASSVSSLEEVSSPATNESGQRPSVSSPPAEIPCRRFPKDTSDLRRSVLTRNLYRLGFFDNLILLGLEN